MAGFVLTGDEGRQLPEEKPALPTTPAFGSCCKVVPLSRRLDQRFLFHPGQRLDGSFAFQCQTSARETFVVDETDRKTTASVSRGGPGIVLVTSTAHVSSDAGVQRVISTPKHVYKPPDI